MNSNNDDNNNNNDDNNNDNNKITIKITTIKMNNSEQ